MSADAGEAKWIGRLGSALRLRFASLPTRIIVLVFAAALVTGIAVTAISMGSTEAFLRSKIEQRFPALLHAVADRIDEWYTQREVDIATFASSDTLALSLAGGDVQRALREARRYLAYVQAGFPQYRWLFVLDRRGAKRVSVGTEVELPAQLVKEIAGVDATRIGAVVGTANHRFQMISAPIASGGKRIGTLHAVLDISSLEAMLVPEDYDAGTRLFVVGPGSTVLAKSPATPARITYERARPTPHAPSAVADYTTPDGVHVVGGAVRLARFDWTLVVEQDYQVAFAPVVSAMGKVLTINLGIVLGFGLLALGIARSIVRPIRALSDGARRIAQGETDIEIPRVQGQDEIGVLSRALHEMVDRLRRNQVELQRKQEQIERANAELLRANEDLHRNNEMLEQLSFTDGLTHLHNHRYFQDRLRIETKRCDRSGEPLSLLLIDIDDFKMLNDQNGHAVGDEVLRRVATILNGAVRETDLPARYGGEEFTVLAPRTDVAGARSLAEKVRKSVAAARFRGLEAEEAISVTVSIGVSIYGGDQKRFFNEADRALYQAKHEGKDCVILFEEPSS